MDNFLNISTFNCAGLLDRKKRNGLFYLLRQKKYDLILLQETHLIDIDVTLFKLDWGGVRLYFPITVTAVVVSRFYFERVLI